MPIDEKAVWSEIHASRDRIVELETRLDERKDLMKETIEAAVESAMKSSLPKTVLTDEEHRWIQLAIRSEAQSIEFRRAVIEKSFTGLVWALIVGIGMILKEYFTAHGWRP